MYPPSHLERAPSPPLASRQSHHTARDGVFPLAAANGREGVSGQAGSLAMGAGGLSVLTDESLSQHLSAAMSASAGGGDVENEAEGAQVCVCVCVGVGV